MAETDRSTLRDPDLVKAVADGIVAARTRNGHSRTTFAGVLGWERSRLVEIELGRREARLVDLERIAEVLNASLGEILAETDRGREAAGRLGVHVPPRSPGVEH